MNDKTWLIALASLAIEPPAWMMSLLSKDEMKASAKAVTPKRKRELVWSRGLRRYLTRHLHENLVVKPISNLNITSSIAHDKSHVAVLCGYGKRAGLDIENSRKVESCELIAETWFPESEKREILSDASPVHRFLRSWTLKEAWAKYANCSIFDACHQIYLCNNVVHIEYVRPPRALFATTSFGDCVISICVDEPTSDCSYTIKVIKPTASELELQCMKLQWNWMEMAC